MTDKELLELAAKAAGMVSVYFVPQHEVNKSLWWGIEIFDYAGGDVDVRWNPLTDDGDALRLAVKLSMKVYVGEAYPWDKKCADYSHRFCACVDEDENNDPYAATRLAIVRAAAEIGKAST